MKFKLIYFFVFLVALSFSQNAPINDAIKRGRDFLKHIQRTDGAIADTLNPLFESWETILAATALYDTQRDTNEITFQKALSFLRNNENANGLICHNRKCKEAYCLETTSQYFLLLIKIGLKEKIKPRLELIQELQKPSGEWEIGNPDVKEIKDFPSVTAFMLQLFNEAGIKPKYEKQAYQWLISKQNTEGHWGSTWEYYDCPLYAIWPVMNINAKELTSAKKKTEHFILKNKQMNGIWNFKTEKGPSAELQTALVLAAMKDKLKDRKTSINFILKYQQMNGSWNGGQFPIKSVSYIKREYVFATALALQVLATYKDQK